MCVCVCVCVSLCVCAGVIHLLWPRRLGYLLGNFQETRLYVEKRSGFGSKNCWTKLIRGRWDGIWSRFFSSVQSLSRVRLLATPLTAALQASLPITNSRSLLKLISTEPVMPSNHLLCCPLLLLPSIFPSIAVFPNESVLRIWWPKYWSFSFSINPSNEYSGLISFRTDWNNFVGYPF